MNRALGGEDFSRITRIVGIFWSPISIGPSHPRIYNFLASNGSNRGRFNETRCHVHNSSWKRHGAPVIIRKFHGRLLCSLGGGYATGSSRLLLEGARIRGRFVSVRSKEKVNFSLLNSVYIVSDPSRENVRTSSWANNNTGKLNLSERLIDSWEWKEGYRVESSRALFNRNFEEFFSETARNYRETGTLCRWWFIMDR